jgi:hypothetical protein
MTTHPVTYIRPVIDHIDQELPGLPPELLRMYSLLALTKGLDTTLEDVHDAWSLWQEQSAPQHRSLIPFGQLSAQVQELDRPYRDAIVHAFQAASHLPQ